MFIEGLYGWSRNAVITSGLRWSASSNDVWYSSPAGFIIPIMKNPSRRPKNAPR